MSGDDHVAVQLIGDHQWHHMYRPRMKGSDAFKVRALIALIKHPGPGKSIFTQLEEQRAQAYPGKRPTRDIGNRPWYYFPSATGKKFPNTQVLHSRTCTDRFHGAEYGEEAPAAAKDSVCFYDFDLLQAGVVGPRLVFCKVCKQYKDPPPPPLPRGRDPLVELVMAAFSLSLPLRRPAPLPLQRPPRQLHTLFYFGGDLQLDVMDQLQQLVSAVSTQPFVPAHSVAHADDALVLFMRAERGQRILDTDIERFLLRFEFVRCSKVLLILSDDAQASESSVFAWHRRGLLIYQGHLRYTSASRSELVRVAEALLRAR